MLKNIVLYIKKCIILLLAPFVKCNNFISKQYLRNGRQNENNSLCHLVINIV